MEKDECEKGKRKDLFGWFTSLHFGRSSRFTAQSAPIILLPDYVPVRIESGLTLALKDFFQMSHAELKLSVAEIAAS